MPFNATNAFLSGAIRECLRVVYPSFDICLPSCGWHDLHLWFASEKQPDDGNAHDFNKAGGRYHKALEAINLSGTAPDGGPLPYVRYTLVHLNQSQRESWMAVEFRLARFFVYKIPRIAASRLAPSN